MDQGLLAARRTGPAFEITMDRLRVPALAWTWIDIRLDEGDEIPDSIIENLSLDAVAVRDAVEAAVGGISLDGDSV